MKMARFTLKLTLLVFFVFIFLTEGKKQTESKSEKRQKEEGSANKNGKSEEKDQDFMKTTLTETSLPGTAVAQHSLPAATKESDVLKVKQNSEGDDSEESGDIENQSGSGDEAEIATKVENANKPSKVKSRILVERDRNKIAETIKKSKVAKNKAKKDTASKSQSSAKEETTKKEKTAANKNKQVGADSNGKKKQAEKSDEKDKEKKNKNKKEEKEGKKRSKDSHHHHHHHHHHHNKEEKKNKRPTVANEANKPKIDYPTFNWTKDGEKVKKVAQIPGWGSNAAPGYGMVQMGQAGQTLQMPAGVQPIIPAGMTQRDSVPIPAETLLNGTIKNQADIAKLDQASVASDNSQQKDQTQAQQIQSTTANASDVTNNPIAATVASDTGEVPSNLTKKLDIQIPSSIPNRCMSLVKSYTNAELTLRDYLKLLRKCKKADADFNSIHPNGVAMLRDSISKNGPYLTKEAYQYALERVRNYVPSSKEKEAADMILAKWRTNSFGNRGKINNNGDVPDAIKSFMTGQTSIPDKTVKGERNIEEQTQKAIDTAKSYILGAITGHTGDQNKQSSEGYEGGEKRGTIVTSAKQTVLNVIDAAKSLLSGTDNGRAIVLTQGSNKPAVLPLPDVKKQQIATTTVEKKSKALQMAKAADALSSAMMSQLAPNVVTSSEKVNGSLLAALKEMGSGPEHIGQSGVKPSVQKRNLVPNVGYMRRKKRSLLGHVLKKYKDEVRLNRRRRQVREKPFEIDNPSERSKLNKPVIPAPKLMDKIRDMSMVIATP